MTDQSCDLPIPIAAIGKLLNQAMDQAVANGANSISMPDELVEIAHWLAFGVAQGNQDASSEVEIAPESTQITVPQVDSIWVHASGDRYTVIQIANANTVQPTRYPVTVVYRGVDGQIWSRAASDWHRSMTAVVSPTPPDVAGCCPGCHPGSCQGCGPCAKEPNKPASVLVRLASSRAGRTYVAGPMTGIENWNFPAFNEEAERIRPYCTAVINPADHGIVEEAQREDYLRYDIACLMTCERIHLLQGWSKSAGAQLEVAIAIALGMAITYQEGAELLEENPSAMTNAGDLSALIGRIELAIEKHGQTGGAIISDVSSGLPRTPRDIRNFIGSQAVSVEFVNAKESDGPYAFDNAEPSEADKYCVTAHDLLSAFRQWSSAAQHSQASGYPVRCGHGCACLAQCGDAYAYAGLPKPPMKDKGIGVVDPDALRSTQSQSVAFQYLREQVSKEMGPIREAFGIHPIKSNLNASAYVGPAVGHGGNDRELIERVSFINSCFEDWSVKANQGYNLQREEGAFLATYASIPAEHAWRGYCAAALACPVSMETDGNTEKMREAFSRIRGLITDSARIDSHTISLVRVECDSALALPTVAPALQQGVGFFAYSNEMGFEPFKSQDEAIACAQKTIDVLRGDAEDGWADEVDSICWGVVLSKTKQVPIDIGDERECVDYVLTTPAPSSAKDGDASQSAVDLDSSVAAICVEGGGMMASEVSESAVIVIKTEDGKRIEANGMGCAVQVMLTAFAFLSSERQESMLQHQEAIAKVTRQTRKGAYAIGVVESGSPAVQQGILTVGPAGKITLDTDSRVCFYEQDFYVLSNFSSFRVTFEGQTFDTSEAAYHYQRFTSAEDRRAVQYACSAHDAYRYAQDNKSRQRPDWDKVKVGIMHSILWAKVNQHDYVRCKLLETGDRELVENSWRDDYWGWGPDRDGKNMLGKLWMEIRSALRSKAASDKTTGANHV